MAFRANHNAYQQETSIYDISVWYSITRYSRKRITVNGIISNFRYSLAGAPLETSACESETMATAKFSFTRVILAYILMHLGFFLPLLDNTVLRCTICGKAVQLSAGKSERQLCTPSLVPLKPAWSLLSHTSDLLPSRFSLLSIDWTVSLSFTTHKRFACSFSLGSRFV